MEASVLKNLKNTRYLKITTLVFVKYFWIKAFNLLSNGPRCRYDATTNQQGPLLLLMEYYVRHVEPSCPYGDGCTCLLAKVQEGPVSSQAERVYSVQVRCVGTGLNRFPGLPKHTRTVDLSNNEVRKRGVGRTNMWERNVEKKKVFWPLHILLSCSEWMLLDALERVNTMALLFISSLSVSVVLQYVGHSSPALMQQPRRQGGQGKRERERRREERVRRTSCCPCCA